MGCKEEVDADGRLLVWRMKMWNRSRMVRMRRMSDATSKVVAPSMAEVGVGGGSSRSLRRRWNLDGCGGAMEWNPMMVAYLFSTPEKVSLTCQRRIPVAENV